MKKIVAFFTAILGMISLPASCSRSRVPYDYDLTPYITLGQYMGVEAELESAEITQDAIDNEIKYWLEYYGKTSTKTVTDRDTVKDKDVVSIDYVGKIDGKAFDGGSEKNKELKIGSNEFIDGFEDNIIGAKVGNEFSFKLTFPSDFDEKDLAGKLVEFSVKVNAIHEFVYSELTDELVKEMTQGKYTTVRKYTSYIKEYLKDKIKTSNSELIFNQVIENCEIISYPQKEIDAFINDTFDYYRKKSKESELELEEYLKKTYNKTQDEMMEEAQKAAEESVKKELVAYAIIKKEGIELSDKEYEKGAKDYAAYYNYEMADLEKEAGKEQIKKWVLMEKAVNLCVENAVDISNK